MTDRLIFAAGALAAACAVLLRHSRRADRRAAVLRRDLAAAQDSATVQRCAIRRQQDALARLHSEREAAAAVIVRLSATVKEAVAQVQAERGEVRIGESVLGRFSRN